MSARQPADTTSGNVARRGTNLYISDRLIPEDEARKLAGDILIALGSCDFEIYDHPRTDADAERAVRERTEARERMRERAEDYAHYWSDEETVQDLLRQAFLHGVAQAPRSPTNRMGFQRWER